MKSSHSSNSSNRLSATFSQESLLSTAQSTSTSTPVTATSSPILMLPSSQPVLVKESVLVNETLDFISQGDALIASKQIKENIVIVLGPTGAGKGTLINYLSGTALKPMYQDGTWKLSAEKTLSDISISHSRQSDTFYPAIYSPAGKDFSYIDSPGFGDSRGTSHDIATAYFRQKIMEMKEIKSMKVLLTLPYKDFSVGRGDIVKGYINALDQFLQLNKNAKHIDELKQAIALVITQVDAPRFSIKTVEEDLKIKEEDYNNASEKDKSRRIYQKLSAEIETLKDNLQEVSNTSAERKGTIAKAFKEQGGIEPEAKKVFDHLSQASKFEIFSKPIIVLQEKAAMVAGEKEQILRLIDKNRYIEKSKIELGLAVSPDSKLVVIHLAKNINDTISEEVKKSVAEIINICKQEIDTSHEFDSLKAYLSSKLWGLKEVTTSTDSKTFNPEDFSRSVDGKFSNAQEIKKYISYIDFFKKIDSNIGYEVENWNGAFKILQEQIEGLLEPQRPEFQNNVLIIRGALLSLKNHLAINQYAKAIKIYATNKVFLDQDLQLKGVSLAIIAPNLEVVGDNRVIDLSGKDGANYESKAENGQNGKPGHPGGSGGNFLGMSKNYNILDKLTINVNGGTGGKGQDGGDGENGEKGSEGNYEFVHKKDPRVMISRKKILMDDETDTLNKVDYLAKKITIPLNSTFIEKYESKGTSGKDGGDSGRGGEGGEEDIMVIYNLPINLVDQLSK